MQGRPNTQIPWALEMFWLVVGVFWQARSFPRLCSVMRFVIISSNFETYQHSSDLFRCQQPSAKKEICCVGRWDGLFSLHSCWNVQSLFQLEALVIKKNTAVIGGSVISGGLDRPLNWQAHSWGNHKNPFEWIYLKEDYVPMAHSDSRTFAWKYLIIIVVFPLASSYTWVGYTIMGVTGWK